ncbi:MAG: D-aminoacyl-tRNA deacylase [Candidatus Pacearchaeota archaeon]|jgi:D-aminoacyl-tRNA deacylase
MRFAIVYSKQDKAGINIIEQFKKIAFAPEMPIIELKKDSIYADDLNEKNYPELKSIDFIVFATKHKSEKGNPSLSLHAPGNWRQADYGGKPGKICNTSAFVLKYLFQNLNKIANENKEVIEKYQITLECTHHGPLIEKPCCFIELGSSEKQWSEKEPAKIIAKTIATLQNYTPDEKWTPSIAIGGPHYCPNFNKIQLNSNYAISHIIPEYALPLTELILREAEHKTIEQIKEVLVDWKGCGNSEQRQKVAEVIEKSGLKFKRTEKVDKN